MVLVQKGLTSQKERHQPLGKAILWGESGQLCSPSESAITCRGASLLSQKRYIFCIIF